MWPDQFLGSIVPDKLKDVVKTQVIERVGRLSFSRASTCFSIYSLDP